MADRPRIKVAVLEGNYADLCGLGLPLHWVYSSNYRTWNCLEHCGRLKPRPLASLSASTGPLPLPLKRLRWRSPVGSANMVQFLVILTYKVT